VPESDRAARHLLRTRLGRAGFGTPAPGVWISTHADRVGEAERLLDAAGVGADARIFVAEHHSGDLASMVRQAWDLDEIELRYQAFLAEFTAPRAADPLADVVALVHAWRRFPWTDPMLPRELLPRRWSGERAAKLFAARHAAWSAGAISEWARVND
jgi:phenylacetic acid degradation operon negative regulatory protein